MIVSYRQYCIKNFKIAKSLDLNCYHHKEKEMTIM